MAPFVAAALMAMALGLIAGPAREPPVAGLILFWSDRGQPGPSLWAMRPDGSDQHLVYRSFANAKRPALSPDGAWVAFDGASPGKRPFSDFDVQIVRTDGTDRRTVAGTTANEVDAQWSPDGETLSFSRWSRSADWRSSSVWTVRSDGTGLHRIGRGLSARWSPDGKRLVLGAPTKGSDGDLFLVRSDGSGRRRLTSTIALEQPAGWSPDGRKLLVTRYRVDGTTEIVVMRADGTHARTLFRTSGSEASAAAWSPDGSQIAYTAYARGHAQVFVMGADGSHRHNISRSRNDDIATSWR
jgi:TolB protein